MSMATKLGRMVTYLECLPPIKVLIPLVTWSCKISWQTKTIIYPLPQCLWPPDLPVWWLTLRGSYHIVTRPLIRLLDHVIIWKFYFSTFTRLVATKLGRVLTSANDLARKRLSLHQLFVISLIQSLENIVELCSTSQKWFIGWRDIVLFGSKVGAKTFFNKTELGSYCTLKLNNWKFSF